MAKNLVMAAITLVLCGSLGLADDIGAVIFYRPKHDAGKPSVFCDGVRVARLAGESVFTVHAAVGRHVCTVDRLSNAKGAAAIDVAPGTFTYLRVDEGWGYHLRVIPPSEAANVAAMLKPVQATMVFEANLGVNTYATAAAPATASSGAPSAMIAPTAIRVEHDTPLATTSYYPAKTAHVSDGPIFWRVYPYLEQKGDGSISFHLRLSVFPAMDNSWSFEEMKFVVDGRDELPVSVDSPKATANWPLGYTSYDFAGPELGDVVERLAAAQEAWLVIYATGDPVRSNLRLKPEQLDAFRVILAQYDRLQAGEPGSE